jgi:alcohol dehydrogenase
MRKMKAAVFVEPGRIVLDEKPIPTVGLLDALVRITTTTICGTDVHIMKGEYPVAKEGQSDWGDESSRGPSSPWRCG